MKGTHTHMIKPEKQTFKLCCGGKKCPVVDIDGNNWSIKDDFGGSVKLTTAQISELINHPTTSKAINAK